MRARLAALGSLILVVTAAVAAPSQARTPNATKTGSAWDLCATAVRQQEARFRIPKKLMRAVSLVESGQWNPKRRQTAAWPWTIHAEGKGRIFPTKQAAVRAVRSLQARGVHNIDVGCMQVNLHYHPKAFRSVERAFDPVQNARYAAGFLIALKREHGSWRRAVQHYHSATPKRRLPYQKRVYAVWREALRGTDNAKLPGSTSRLRRAARKVNREHRAKLAAHRPRQPVKESDSVRHGPKPAARAPGTKRFRSYWPRRGVKAQRRAQNIARVRALTPPRGATDQ